jgi:exodeoxyribonuclease VII small subunit
MSTDDRPVDELPYRDAVAELEQILDELENDTVDVDVLAARVRRAAELIRVCRARINGARLEIERIVVELESDDERGADDREPAGDGGS